MTKDEMAMALAGLSIAALTEGLAQTIRQLRETAGDDLDNRLASIEATVIRSLENTVLDGVPEADQVVLVERARGFVRSIFGKLRRGEM